MKSTKNTDHVVMAGDAGNTFHCLHCNQRYTMNLPCNIDVFVAASRAFIALHASCLKPETQR